MKILIKYGSDVSAVDKSRRTALSLFTMKARCNQACSATPSHHTGGERKCQISRGVCTLPIAKTPTGEAYELDLHLPFQHFLHMCVRTNARRRVLS